MEIQLINRYKANLNGVLSCYDRILITGTLPGACYAKGMTSFLYSKGIGCGSFRPRETQLRCHLEGPIRCLKTRVIAYLLLLKVKLQIWH